MIIFDYLMRAFGLSVFAVAAMSNISIAQEIPTAPEQPQTQRVCAFDTIENLLPPLENQQNPSGLSYLALQGFTQNPDGSWVCYVGNEKKQGRYYTLLKVQEINGMLVATSFLEEGRLIDGQENRSLDLFMMLIEKHTKTNPGNRQSIQRYLKSFISLVKEGKIKPSPRGFLFDQPNRAFVIYHPIAGEKLKGTAITINIGAPQNTGSSTVSPSKSNTI